MNTKPNRSEAVSYYFTYIDRVESDDIVEFLSMQLNETLPVLLKISEDKSLFRYDPSKWSIRQVLNHVTDTERTFLFRSLWFARGLEGSLPSFEQDIAAANADADGCSWRQHVEELRLTRLATHMFFSNLPSNSWGRSGIASEKSFTVRAMAFIIAGHFDHHMEILRQRYLA
jgi:hypothetical protein